MDEGIIKILFTDDLKKSNIKQLIIALKFWFCRYSFMKPTSTLFDFLYHSDLTKMKKKLRI